MSKFTIGVDVGGTNVKLGLVSSSGKIVSRGHILTKEFFESKAKLIEAIVEAIQTLIKANNLKNKDINAIGMGWPGLIDPYQGKILVLPNIPGWKNVELVNIMRQKLNIPIFIENDVNLITLAEWKLGAGRGYKNLVCITLGTGVGGGLILDNKIYRGEGFLAGEIGHMPLNDKTLELYVGNKYLLEKGKKIFKDENFQLPQLSPRAASKDPRALEFLKEIGVYIGTTMAGVVNLLNPRLIIIGGGVSNHFKYFAPHIYATIQERAMKVPAKMVKIVRAQLGNDAGILGAPILVKESKD